ncbi:MAG: histidine kinase N-terminal 7TM domain-containing protein [Candidatus Omnitrophota bacterium]
MSQWAVSNFFTSFATLFLSAFVFFSNRKSKANRIFCLYSLSISEWSFFTAFHAFTSSSSVSLFSAKIMHLGVLLIPILFFHFSLAILDIYKKHKNKLFVGYLISSILIILNFTTNLIVAKVRPKLGYHYFMDGGILYPFVILLFVFYTIFGLYLLLKGCFIYTGNKKNQLKYLFTGSLLGYVFGVSCFLPVYNIIIFPYPIGSYAISVYVFITTYAIVKYRLMDINVALTRAGIFAIVYTLVLGLPFWLGYKLLGNGDWFNILLFGMVIATLGPFIYQYLRKRTEDILFRKEHLYQQALKEFAKTLTLIKDFNTLLGTITSKIVDLLKVSVGIYLKDKESNSYLLKHNWPKENNFPKKVSTDSLVIGLLYENKKSIFGEQIVFDSDFSNKDIALIVPCFVKNELLGFIVLGKKSKGQVYSQIDIDIFEILSSYLGLTFENLNYLIELENLHQQLLEKERLISASEISEAYNHELGNIINNISMASSSLSFEESSKEEIKNVYEAIKRNIKRAKEIFESVSSYDVKAKSQFILRDLNQIFKEILNSFKQKIETFKINLTEDFYDVLPLIPLNENFPSAFNYILNAAVNSMEKQPAKELFVSTKLNIETNSVRIMFQDTGGDVTQDKYYHGVAPERGQVGGIYYFIARRIVFDHQGTWKIESNNNIGTRIVIDLPIKRQE